MAAVSPAGPDPMMTMRSCTELLISVQYNAESLSCGRVEGRLVGPDLHDPLGGPPVPKLRPAARIEAPVQDPAELAADLFAVPPAQDVRAHLAGDRPLGVLAQ